MFTPAVANCSFDLFISSSLRIDEEESIEQSEAGFDHV
jgi:hypothetical protein